MHHISSRGLRYKLRQCFKETAPHLEIMKCPEREGPKAIDFKMHHEGKVLAWGVHHFGCSRPVIHAAGAMIKYDFHLKTVRQHCGCVTGILQSQFFCDCCKQVRTRRIVRKFMQDRALFNRSMV